MTNRLSPIYTSNDPAKVYTELSNLYSLYQRTFRKALPVDLYFATWGGWGGKKSTTGPQQQQQQQYGITLTWENGQETDAEWVKGNVGKGAVS